MGYDSIGKTILHEVGSEINYYHRFLHKVTRREIVIKTMVALNFVVIFVLYQYFHRVASALPFSFEEKDIDESSNGSITFETIENNRILLENLVDSPENKAIFIQLQDSDNAFYDTKTNTVGTAKFPRYNQYQRQPYVSNGYIGSRIPNLGQGFTYDQLSDSPDAVEDDLLNGWPLFNERFSGSFIGGFYDIQKNTTKTNFPELIEKGYESILSAVPQWTTLTLSTVKNGKTFTLDPSLSVELQGDISNYAQNLSLSDGIVTTEFTWLESIYVQIEIVAHKADINLGIVNLKVFNLGNSTADLTVEDRLDFNSTKRCQLTDVGKDDEGIFIHFQPNEIDYVNGAIYSKLDVDGGSTNSINRESTHNASSQTLDFSIEASKSFKVTKFVGIISSDLDPQKFNSADKVNNFAKEIATKQTDSVSKLIASHKVEWSHIFEASNSITFPSDPLLTLAARASVYHLNTNTRPNAQGVTAAMPVGGLSSDSYGGMVFWDTDLWMLNGLLPFNPSNAKSIVNYRIHTHQQAVENVPKNQSGAVYPWTSGRFGNCTSTGPCLDYEYHINIAVAMAAWEVYLSGAADDYFLESVTYPLIYDAATFLADYVQYNDSVGKYVSSNMTDPDEYANHVDNAAYTNAGISLLMKWAIIVSNHLGKSIPSKFTDIAGNMFLPTSNTEDNVTLEYDGMNSSVGIKQADVIMMTYPLGNELISDEQAFTNMQFYSMKQVNYGPAMTFPIFSIVASNLSPSGCASQSFLHKAVQPFLRAPFAQFSEQNNDNFLTNGGTHPAFPFMTAHGGFLQAILQGLTGLRFDYEIDDNDNLSRLLVLDPVAIPCLGNGVQFDSIKYMNQSISLAINETSFIIKNNGALPGEKDNAVRISLAERNPKKGIYTLNKDDELVFPLYEPELSFPSSISECSSAHFINITEGAFGDASVLINDGDNTTHWQLKYNDTTAKILVDLKESRNLTRGLLNWGDKPPKSWTLLAFTSKEESTIEDLNDVLDFLSKVNFGNDLYKNYNYLNTSKIYEQKDVFESIINENVEISAPFDPVEYAKVEVPTVYNTTTFEIEQGLNVRFLLIEVDDIHDTEPIDGATGGAKLNEVVLY